MTSDMSAAQLLEEWLGGPHLRSRVQDYLNAMRTSKHFGYAHYVARHGQIKAEAWLAEQAKQYALRPFAVSVKPVAKGMLALAKVHTDTYPLAYVSSDASGMQQRVIDSGTSTPMVVVLNRPNPPVRITQRERPTGHFFSPDGASSTLGLRAVTLRLVEGTGGLHARLRLVFDNRVRHAVQVGPQGWVILDVSTYGMPRTFRMQPRIREEVSLHAALGLDMPRDLVDAGEPWIREDCSFDDSLGFPDALKTIARHMHELPAYLEERAAKIKDLTE